VVRHEERPRGNGVAEPGVARGERHVAAGPGDHQRLLSRRDLRVDEERDQADVAQEPQVEGMVRRPEEQREDEREGPLQSSMHSTSAPFSYAVSTGTTTKPLAFVSANRSADPCQGTGSATLPSPSSQTRAGR